MQCLNCGHDNQPNNSFCVKCATAMSNRAKLGKVKQTFVPPQNDHIVEPQTVQAKPSRKSREGIDWSWMLVGIALFALLLFLIYG